MTQQLRYAGFDPDEDNFDGIGLAPLQEDELRRPRFMLINTARAWELKHSGLTWAAIGRQLAKEVGRKMPYLAHSVFVAANYFEPARSAAMSRSPQENASE